MALATGGVSHVGTARRALMTNELETLLIIERDGATRSPYVGTVTYLY